MAVKEKRKAKVAMGSTSATLHTPRESSVMADSSGLLQTLQGHVEEVRALIQCGICVRPLYEPYTLACGHTFCYGCLTSWFSSGRSHKTCPDCRAQVKIQPAPAYLVRAIVQMFTSNAELLEKGETTAEHSKSQREEAEKLEADKTNDNPTTGGLFQGCFKPKPHALGPIFDAEDGVARCPNCAWELEEDACINCGYHVDDGTIDSDDFSDMTDEDDEDDEDEDEDEDDIDDDHSTDYDGGWVDNYPQELPFNVAQQLYDVADMGDHPFFGHHHYQVHNHQYMPPFWLGEGHYSPMDQTDASSMTHTSENESDERSDNSEEDDDEEMDSFIDDGSIHYENSVDSEAGYNTDHSTVVGDRSDEIDPGTDRSSPESVVAYGGRCPMTELGSDDEDEDEDEDEEDEPIRPAPIRRPGQNPSYRNNPISRMGLARNYRVGAPISQVHSRPATGTSFNRGGAFRAPRRILIPSSPNTSGAGTSANNAINVEDDSEDEMPVPATRRFRTNRH